VERSPNKRVLPVDPTDPAPGLWAADEVRGSAETPPQLAEVELPVPDSDISGLETRFCAFDMQRLFRRMLVEALRKLANEVCTPGSQLHRLATKTVD
jgi:hypothetical protein